MIKQKGFTLVEVLFALVIISVSFAAVMVAINNAIKNLSHIRQKTASTWVASNVIARAQMNLLEGNTSGHEKMLDRDYSWQLALKPTQNNDMKELIVTVSDAQTNKRITTLHGYLGGDHE